MTDADIEATKAPLMDHLIELRSRLIKALVAFLAMFLLSFFFAKDIYNLLVLPYQHAAGPDAKLIYTAPQEYFFTQIKVALFTAAFLACPIIFSQVYAFVAPGLYKHERNAFRPYLFATPVFFALGDAARLFHRHAEPAAVLHRHAAGQRAGQGADRIAAAGQRISLADHDADLCVRRDVPIAGGADAARRASASSIRRSSNRSAATRSCSSSSSPRC